MKKRATIENSPDSSQPFQLSEFLERVAPLSKDAQTRSSTSELVKSEVDKTLGGVLSRFIKKPTLTEKRYQVLKLISFNNLDYANFDFTRYDEASFIDLLGLAIYLYPKTVTFTQEYFDINLLINMCLYLHKHLNDDNLSKLNPLNPFKNSKASDDLQIFHDLLIKIKDDILKNDIEPILTDDPEFRIRPFYDPNHDLHKVLSTELFKAFPKGGLTLAGSDGGELSLSPDSRGGLTSSDK